MTLSWQILVITDSANSFLLTTYQTSSHYFTHWSRVTHICVSESGQHWFRKWLVAYSASTHYLNQCWFTVNWTLRNKLQPNFNRNSNIYLEDNAFENAVCKKAAILSQLQCVKPMLNTPNYMFLLWNAIEDFTIYMTNSFSMLKFQWAELVIH